MRYIFSLIACVMLLQPVQSANASETTIYLIRHAEKTADGSEDPALTARGRQRAVWYGAYFADKNLSALYSTDFRRTRATAEPVARITGLEIQSYDAGDLAATAERLRKLQGAILVVGHSNTTPVLAGLLCDKAMPPLDEQIYDNIYIVTIDNEGTTRLHLDHSDPGRE